MELPKKFKGTVYFYWNAEYNFFHVSARENSGDAEYLLLGKVENVEVDFTLSHEEAVKQIVKGLNDEKKKIQAKAQQELNKIDDKINSLLAITYTGE